MPPYSNHPASPDTKPRILLQLDGDAHASVFDSIVAIDAGCDHLLPQAGVTPQNAAAMVHGCIFTRGDSDLASTAIFIGGSDVAQGQAILQAVRDAFFGPMRVSVMLDANGANTTAAAAVLTATKHLDLAAITALVAGGTGPVGQRVAMLLAMQGATVKLASRSQARADAAALAIQHQVEGSAVTGAAVVDDDAMADALQGVQLLIAAGAAGVELVSQSCLEAAGQNGLNVAIDLNAVPPAGIGGISATDKAVNRHGVTAYGPIAVGGLKMKIHKKAIARLFERNDLVLDAKEIFTLGQTLLKG